MTAEPSLTELSGERQSGASQHSQWHLIPLAEPCDILLSDVLSN